MLKLLDYTFFNSATFLHHHNPHFKQLQKVLTLRAFWDLEKTVLHEIRISGTVLMDSLSAIFPH